MIGILSVLFGFLIILWMFYDFIWPPAPVVNRRLGKPDEPIEYNVKHTVVAVPRSTGGRLLFLKWLGRTGLGNLLKKVICRKIELDLLRKIRIPDGPTLFPVVNTPWKNKEHEAVDFDKLIEKSTKVPEASFKFVTIVDLHKKYRLREVTPLQIAERVLEIINDTEKQTPKLRAIVQYNKEEILKMAEASTRRHEDGKPLSFMDGIPVAVKEEISVVPYRTRCGTTFMGEIPATEDAYIVKKLRDGGAIIIGVTNMHELGIGTTGSNPNRLHGTPRNPYNVRHYTGGSSSGSAVCVAAGLCPVALGTDGGGSVRIPAAACGIVGIKASFGRISTSGIFRLCHSVTFTGPLCTTVKDAALVYAYLSGENKDDPRTFNQPPVTLEGIENTSLEGVTIGIDWKYFKDCDPEVYEKCEKVVKSLEDGGATVVPIQIPELQETISAHAVTILSEMASTLEEEYYKYYNEMNADTVSGLGIGRVFTARDYVQAMKQRTRSMTFLKKIFQDDSVDCIITPALGGKVPEIPEDAVPYGESDVVKTATLMWYMGLGNFTGVPGMTLPVGYDDKGLPIGLQVMSSWWNEHVMIRVAHAAEEFVTRKKPQVYYNLLE